MKCLIIYRSNQNPLPHFHERLSKAGVEIVSVHSGLCRPGRQLCHNIITDGPFQLIIHHCGSMNQEYRLFLKKFYAKCEQQGWDKPLVLLVTGSAYDELQAREAYPSDPLIRVLYFEYFGKLLDQLYRFLIQWQGAGWIMPPDIGTLMEDLDSVTIRGNLHRLTNLLAKPVPLDSATIKGIRDEIKALNNNSVVWEVNAAGIVGNMMGLTEPSSINDAVLAGLRQLLSLLQDKLDLDPHWHQEDLSDTSLPSHPPEPYRTILVADDDSYPVECVHYLKQKGYGITVVTDYSEAMEMLCYDPSTVFLCDLTFGSDSQAGRHLMRAARQLQPPPIIIALSSSRLYPAEVPEADEICDGVQAKTELGAKWVHKIIWRLAQNPSRSPDTSDA